MGRVVIVCAILALTVWLVRAQADNRPKDCEPCEPDTCEEPSEACEAGTIVDRCGCCKICAQREHERCDHPKVKRSPGVYDGRCGDNLVCQLRDDLDKDAPAEAWCVCSSEETLCGADKKTYPSLCTLAAAGIKQNKKIKVEHMGHCRTAAEIISPPENLNDAVAGGNYTLACEAKGVPLPSIEWTFTNAAGETKFLPSDGDQDMSINLRGGPNLHEVTGWLQIMDIQKKHEGDYTCIAQNEIAMMQRSGRINVSSQEWEKIRMKDEN